jgi:hypothetical protein
VRGFDHGIQGTESWVVRKLNGVLRGLFITAGFLARSNACLCGDLPWRLLAAVGWRRRSRVSPGAQGAAVRMPASMGLRARASTSRLGLQASGTQLPRSSFVQRRYEYRRTARNWGHSGIVRRAIETRRAWRYSSGSLWRGRSAISDLEHSIWKPASSARSSTWTMN